jgi:hypothetical protein
MCVRASQKRKEEVGVIVVRAHTHRLYIYYQRARDGERVLLPRKESDGGTNREIVVGVYRQDDAITFISFLFSLSHSFS